MTVTALEVEGVEAASKICLNAGIEVQDSPYTVGEHTLGHSLSFGSQ
jgi:hypothetical protein